MQALLSSRTSKLSGILVAFVLLLAAVWGSITLGVYRTGWDSLLEAFRNFNGSNEHIVIREVRIPRALIGTAVGASLGIAGTLLQALTRNPLADMGILGLNHGASLCVVAAVTFLQVSSLSQYVWFAFAGTAIFGIAVYMLGSLGRGGMSPLKITLSGAALGALASSFTHSILLIREKTMQEVLFWLSGSVEGRKLELLLEVLPFMAVGWAGAFLLAGPINTLLLGEDVAVGLGQRTAIVKLMTGLVIVLLAGSSVAAAGPILFIGLITPHLCRYLVGPDIRWVVVYSGLLGAVLLVTADIAARFAAPPNEVPIGVLTAFIGTPFFIYAARKGAMKG